MRARADDAWAEYRAHEAVEQFVAYLGGQPIAAAGVLLSGNGVALLLGGATLQSVRGRGAYRALVRARWELAANPEFDGKLVIARKGAAPIEIGAGLSLTVAGPMAPEVKKLHDKHETWLKTQKKKSPEAALAAYLDKSVPNLSSLVVLAEAEGKRMLLTGDARGDKILKGLELVGALEKAGDIHIDLLKVPHHGSANNLETGFFERITADHYVFSGNGEHGNPERLALEMLVEARGDEGYTIHLTYPVAEIDAARKDDWEKEQAKETVRKKKKPRTKVREDWAPAMHGLAAFFTDHPGLKKRVKIVDAEKPHVIDLADKLSKAWPGLDG